MPGIQIPPSAWTKGHVIDQKRRLMPEQVRAIRARLSLASNLRDLALFNVAFVAAVQF